MSFNRPTGPLGSVKKKGVIDVSELASILNRPMSKLADMWNRDALTRRADSVGDTVPIYKPSNDVKSKLIDALLPCERCKQRKTNRAGRLYVGYRFAELYFINEFWMGALSNLPICIYPVSQHLIVFKRDSYT